MDAIRLEQKSHGTDSIEFQLFFTITSSGIPNIAHTPKCLNVGTHF
jgi:hypothetical protein